MKVLNRIVGVLIIVIALAFSGASAEARVQLIFTEEAQCNGARILLGDIATIQGEGDLVDKLKHIDIGPAPSPGGKFTLTQEIITGNITRHGIQLSQLELIGISPKGIIVRGAGQLVTQEIVLEKVYDYVYSHLPDQFSEVEISLKSFPEIWLPYEDYQIEVGPHRSTKIWGFLSLPVTVFVAGKQVDRKQISLEIKVFQTVFIVRENIDRGVIITPDSVELSYLEVTTLRGEPVKSGEEIFGKVAKRALKQGEIITVDLLDIPKMVVRNEQVIIEVKLGGIYIQTMGKALQDGALGEWINVQNATSGVTIQAQVTGMGRVQAQVKPNVD